MKPRSAALALALALAVLTGAGCGWPARTRRAEASWQAAARCLEGPGDAVSCEAACVAGVALACTARGRLALKASPPDRRGAVTRFDRACRMGDGHGCLEAGLMFEHGIDGPADPALALRFFRKACDANAVAGCTNLGLAFHRGEVVSRDEPRAVRLYEKGCEGGDPGGCANLAYVLHYGLGIEQDPERARALYTTACKVRHPGACENLATLLVSVPEVGLSGRARKTEPERAAAYWREACASPPSGPPAAAPTPPPVSPRQRSSGDAVGPASPRSSGAAGRQTACVNYAVCLETGLGVPSDAVKARALLRAACEDGHVEGCLQLAVSLEASTAPEAPVERAEALRLYRRVCAATAGAGNRDFRACKAAERLESAPSSGLTAPGLEAPPAPARGGLDGL